MRGGTRKRGKTWSYYFDTATIAGKRQKKEKGGFRTKKEAEAALAKAMAEYSTAGVSFEPSTISVADYLEYWMTTYVNTELTDNTQHSYDCIIRTHILPEIGSYRLAALQPATIQALINKKKEEGYSKSTLNVIMAILSGALDRAVEPLQYIRSNPCDRVKIGKVNRPKRDRIIVSREQYLQILEMFPFGSWEHILIQLGWNCGLRIGEALGLTWDCVDFAAGTINIEKQLIQPKNDFILKEPKYNSIRKIAMGNTIASLLRAEKRRQAENELQYGEFYTTYTVPSPIAANRSTLKATEKGNPAFGSRIHLICTQDNGCTISKSRVTGMTKKIKEIIPGFDYHSLRHSHATILVSSGVNFKAVQQRLGHKNIATTLNTYAHFTDDMSKEAADVFEKAANGYLPPK